METIRGIREELDRRVVTLLGEFVEKTLREKDFVVLGVPGGRSVRGIFERFKSADLPWEKIHIFMVDERFVPVTDSESNFGQAQELFIGDLFRRGKLPEENVHPFVSNGDGEESVREYAEEFKEFGGKFDVVLLAMGEDCHTASLFPEHDELASHDCFVYVDDSPKSPKERMSATRALLEKSGAAILLAYGKDKKEAYEDFVDESVKVEACPSRLLYVVKDFWVLTDLE